MKGVLNEASGVAKAAAFLPATRASSRIYVIYSFKRRPNRIEIFFIEKRGILATNQCMLGIKRFM